MTSVVTRQYWVPLTKTVWHCYKDRCNRRGTQTKIHMQKWSVFVGIVWRFCTEFELALSDPSCNHPYTQADSVLY